MAPLSNWSLLNCDVRKSESRTLMTAFSEYCLNFFEEANHLGEVVNISIAILVPLLSIIRNILGARITFSMFPTEGKT